jgi:transcriptional regulator with XRE-family HTH domain
VRLDANLRKAREKRGWSQEEMAFQCGVHRTYVGSVDRGEYNVTIPTLRRFTKALGTSLRDALRGISKTGVGLGGPVASRGVLTSGSEVRSCGYADTDDPHGFNANTEVQRCWQ